MKLVISILVAGGALALALPGGAAARGDLTTTIDVIASEADGDDFLLAGRVLSNRAACRKNRKLFLQTDLKAGWQTLDTDRTSKHGAWGLVGTTDDVNTQVRVKAPRKEVSGGTCPPDAVIVLI